jgi:hypothetical protein
MFPSDTDRVNDPFSWIDGMAPRLLDASRELLKTAECARVSDEAVAQIMTAAIRLYVAKSDGEERTTHRWREGFGTERNRTSFRRFRTPARLASRSDGTRAMVPAAAR